MADETLNDNRIYQLIKDDLLFGPGVRRINEDLLDKAEKGSVRALQLLDVQFSLHPELATEQKVNAISGMIAADKNTSSAFREAGRKVLETIRSPKNEPAIRIGASPVAANGFECG